MFLVGTFDWTFKPFYRLELAFVDGIKANRAPCPFVLRNAQVMQNAWVAENLGRVRLMQQIVKARLTCPHFVILGAVGGDRHIGHVVKPSSSSLPAEAEASADDRNIITWRISCHWKKLK